MTSPLAVETRAALTDLGDDHVRVTVDGDRVVASVVDVDARTGLVGREVVRMSVEWDLDPAERTYATTFRTFRVEGLSASAQVQRGRVRTVLDVTAVSPEGTRRVRVDTADVVGPVEQLLAADGWSRRRGFLSRLLGGGA